MHLNAEELVDIAEGTRAESAAPHLAGCEPCRAQLRELRAMIATARDVDVPEPSPLFWDHLSARIGDAIASDSAQPRRSWRYWRSALGPIEVLAVAAALIVAVVSSVWAPAPLPSPPSMVAVVPDAVPAVELLDDPATNDDASLTL